MGERYRPKSTGDMRELQEQDVHLEVRSSTPPLTIEMMQRQSEARQETVSTGSFLNETHFNTSNWAVFKDDRLLGEFDPSTGVLGINDWLNRVNQCAKMYHWDDMTIVYLALGKLKGLARLWYESLNNTQYSWAQWQELLKNTFPQKTNFGHAFHDAAAYKARFGQDLYDYCFQKVSKLNKLKLNLTDEQIIDCVIEGVQDKQIQLTLRAANCKTFVSFAAYVKNFPSSSGHSNSFTSVNRKRKFDSYSANSQKNTATDKVRCFVCKELGHKRNSCPNINNSVPIKCNFCNKIGHTENVCRKKTFEKSQKQTKSINLIATTQKNIYFKRAKINNIRVECFVDFGSECTLIKRSLASKLNLTLSEIANKIELRGFSGGSVTPFQQCWANVTIGGVCLHILIYVIEDKDMFIDLLVGHTFTENQSLIVIKTSKQLIFSKLPSIPEGNIEYKRFLNINILQEYSSQQLNFESLKSGNINSQQKLKLFELLQKYKHCFCFHLNQLGCTNKIEMKIELSSDKPVVYKPYRLSISERSKVKQITDELLEAGIIRESRSPYASPILLVNKKDGGVRMCIDFRALNLIRKKK